MLLSKLKDLDAKPKVQEMPPPPMPEIKHPLGRSESSRGVMRVDNEEDFKKMPYEGKAKYDHELKALNAMKTENPELSQKPKKMFFENMLVFSFRYLRQARTREPTVPFSI